MERWYLRAVGLASRSEPSCELRRIIVIQTPLMDFVSPQKGLLESTARNLDLLRTLMEHFPYGAWASEPGKPHNFRLLFLLFLCAVKSKSATKIEAWLTHLSPGRFYAVEALKMMVGHVLEKYDFELEDHTAQRTFSWRSATIPRSNIKISLRRKEK